MINVYINECNLLSPYAIKVQPVYVFIYDFNHFFFSLYLCSSVHYNYKYETLFCFLHIMNTIFIFAVWRHNYQGASLTKSTLHK